MTWFPLKTNNWWALDMRKFSYGNKTIGQYDFYDEAIAVIDTGTSLLGLPQSLYTEFKSEYEAQLSKG